MNPREHFENEGIEFARYEFKKYAAYSICGKATEVTSKLKTAIAQGIVPTSQIAQFGVSKDGANVHIVVLQNAKGQIEYNEAVKLQMDGYDYVHKITWMDEGIIAFILDSGFTPLASHDKPCRLFVDATFYNGTVKDQDSNTMLLLGRAGDNRVLACQWGKKIPLRTVKQKIDGNARYTNIKGNTLIAVAYGTGQIAALTAEQLVNALKTDGQPTWQTFVIPGVQIEDISVSIGDNATVVMTATIENTRYVVPANVLWLNNKIFGMVLDRKRAVEMDSELAPIVRIDMKSQTVAAVDGNGGRLRLQTSDLASYWPNQAFQQMARDASSGKVFNDMAI